MNALFGFVKWAIGTLIAITLDVVVFGALTAIPLAALVYLGLIGRSSAMGVIGGVAVLAAIRVIVVSTFKVLNQ